MFLVAVAVLSGCSLGSPAAPAQDATAKKDLPSSIWKSADAGIEWEAKANMTGSKIALDTIDVLSIAINPTDPNMALFGTIGNGIFKTTDGGQTIQPTNFISEKVYGLGFDPKDGKIIYASGVWQGRGKIFKSVDSGDNWKEIYTVAANGPLVISLTIDVNSTNVVYVTTSDNQVLKSMDGGETWKNIYSAESPAPKFAIDRRNSNSIYFLTVTGNVFRSRDGGQKFEDVSQRISAVSNGNQDFKIIITDPTNAGWAYVAGAAGLYRTKNSGDSWEKIFVLDNPQNFPLTALAISPKNSNEIVYGASQATYRSTDGGKNWATHQFVSARAVNVLKYSEKDANIIYLGFKK